VEVDIKTCKEEVTGKTGKNKNTSKVKFRLDLKLVGALSCLDREVTSAEKQVYQDE
jgi:hypothetical protein